MFIRAQPCSSLQTACFVPWKKKNPEFFSNLNGQFYGPLSVCTTGFDCKYNETYDTIFELGKNWGEGGSLQERKGVSRYIASALITGDL